MKEHLCDHTGGWRSHPPVPIGVQNGALLVTVMYCETCGHVEYRCPPILLRDEEELDKRMEKVQNRQRILEPAKGMKH